MARFTSLSAIEEPIVVGADRLLRYKILRDESDDPLDLTGGSAEFTIHECTDKDRIDPTPRLKLTVGDGIVIPDPTNGIVDVTIRDTDGPALSRNGDRYSVVLRLKITDASGNDTWPPALEAIVSPY